MGISSGHVASNNMTGCFLFVFLAVKCVFKYAFEIVTPLNLLHAFHFFPPLMMEL